MMPDVTFPLGLPQKHLVPYGDTQQDLTIKTTMEAGRVKIRKRFTEASRFVTAPFILTKAEWDLLKDFYNENCADEWNWIEPEDGVTPVICRFVSMPQPTRITPDLYQVSFEYEILPDADS